MITDIKTHMFCRPECLLPDKGVRYIKVCTNKEDYLLGANQDLHGKALENYIVREMKREVERQIRDYFLIQKKSRKT